MRRLVMSVCLIALILVHGMCAGAYERLDDPPVLVSRNVQTLAIDGLQFKDLNKNGRLDAYEDWRLDATERASDLLRQMTAEEKAAQMVHMTLVQPKETWFRDINVGSPLYTTTSQPARRRPDCGEPDSGVVRGFATGGPSRSEHGLGQRR